MLTLPDFKSKKILFVLANKMLNEPDSLKLENDNVVLFHNEQKVNQIPITLIFHIFIVGDTSITTKLLVHLFQAGVGVSLLNSSLKSTFCLNPCARGNTLLRSKQYTVHNDFLLKTAKLIITNKIENQQLLVKKNKINLNLTLNLSGINEANIDQLRGIEGSISAKYFKAIFADLNWYRRAPQVREDIPNLLLDIGYTFLFNFVAALLELFGFDTYKGCYHQLFFERQSLVCDVMEPLRPLIDERLIKAYHLKEINERDFKFSDQAYIIRDWSRRKKYCDMFASLLMDRKTDIYNYIYSYYRYFVSENIKPYRKFNL